MGAAKYKRASSLVVVAEGAASLCLAMGLICLVVLMSLTKSSSAAAAVRGSSWPSVVEKACDEIYVVGEGETLHTISDKCADPYIVERNPHIHDPDDVFPGLVIKIVPLTLQ